MRLSFTKSLMLPYFSISRLKKNIHAQLKNGEVEEINFSLP